MRKKEEYTDGIIEQFKAMRQTFWGLVATMLFLVALMVLALVFGG